MVCIFIQCTSQFPSLMYLSLTFCKLFKNCFVIQSVGQNVFMESSLHSYVSLCSSHQIPLGSISELRGGNQLGGDKISLLAEDIFKTNAFWEQN